MASIFYSVIREDCREISSSVKEYEDFLYIDVVPEDKRNAPFYEKNGFKVLDDAIPLQIKGKNWN